MEKSSALFLVTCVCFIFVPTLSLTANVTVSLDGTANYTSIGAAISAAPNNSEFAYSIYVKQGTYFEKVSIGMEKTHLILIGDGMGQTIITYNSSNSTGSSTSKSYTVDVTTSWFLARDLSIVNSAGPKGGQAVALRIAGNNIACHRCSVEGHQDTLFLAYGVHQFFYECNIIGTVDFIFDDSAVVIQNSNIYATKPAEGQGNVITAQGREFENKSTAIVIHNCTISATAEFEPYKSTVKTTLGRPWKQYSRTIIMESYLGDLIDPEGWSEFNGKFALDTLYYAEYANRGPGAFKRDRVKWPGYHILINAAEVQNFRVENFIHGSDWLPQLEVPFIPGLIG